MSINPLITLLFSVFILSACTPKDTGLKQHEVFIGHWNAIHSQIIIQENGHIEYKSEYEKQENDQHVHSEVYSRSYLRTSIQKIDSTVIQAGIPFFPDTFKVNQAPHLVDGKWHMTIDDEEYIKQ